MQRHPTREADRVPDVYEPAHPAITDDNKAFEPSATPTMAVRERGDS
jgi:hypothetical protein